MVEYSIQKLEGLAAHIDHLLDTSAAEIYAANRRQNAPKVARAIQGLHGEDQPIIVFRSGDSDLDALFYDLINPKKITGTVKRAGRTYECNLIWGDICRNGLGPNQYERIAKEARRHTLRELEKQDPSGETSLKYLETKATQPEQRGRARRDWVEFLGLYAHLQRLTRDGSYLQGYEESIGEKIDIESLRAELPNSFTSDRLLSTAERILDYDLQQAERSNDFSDYYIRLDLIDVFDRIGTTEAIDKIRERLADQKEHPVVKQEAERILN